MDKSALRKELNESRMSMADDEYTLASRAIVDKLIESVDWSTVGTVHYFEPIFELMEPDISGLVTYLEDTYTKIQLFSPKQIGGEWEMISIKDTPPPEQFDIIIVPMLGFDAQLQRIGYGGGYYDRFLATQPNARKIGICFESGRLDQSIPAEPHDIPLDQVITEG